METAKVDGLAEEESLLLIEVLKESIHIYRREQFFSWLQRSLQHFIPHDVLICAVKQENQSQLYFEMFSSTRYMTDQHMKRVTKEENGLLVRLINAWEKEHFPILLSHELHVTDSGPYRVPFQENEAVLRELEILNIAGHGVSTKEGEVMTFFGFSRVKGNLGPRLAHALELLVPHMHQAFLRVLNYTSTPLNINDQGDQTPAPKLLISSREIEVLQWVSLGKTNSEISNILSLSINTIKNHVHNIILKLGVENRSQAAAMAHKLGLMK